MPNFENKKIDAAKEEKPGRPQFAPSKEMEKLAQQHEKAVQKAVEQSAGPVKFVEQRCHVCTSPHREWIEWHLAKAHSYLSIENAMKGLPEEEQVNRRSISNHVKKGHMDIATSAIRAVIEEEADLEGKNFEEGVRGVLTLRGILEVMARKGFEDVLNDISVVEPKDLIQIVKLKMDMDSKYAQIEVDEARRAIQILTQAVQEVIPVEYQGELRARIKQLRKEQGEELKVENLVPTEIEVESTAHEL